MTRTNCPVCSRKSVPGSIRCDACGADFHDTDMRALMEARAQSPQDTPDRRTEPDGALASSRFLGLSLEPTEVGSSLRKLAALGALLLLAAFFVPLSMDFASFDMAWQVLDQGPALPLLLPPLAAALGLLAALLGRLATWQRAALLIAPAAVGLVTLPALGRFAGTPHTPVPLFLLGLVIAGTALIVRVLRPTSREARHGILAGAVIALAGQLVPVSDPTGLLPVELLFHPGEHALGDTAMPLAAPLSVLSRDVLVFWVCLYLLLPVLALPGAALAAWPRPRGPWDQGGLLTRALAWLVVLYLPLGFALYVFDMMGWGMGIRGVVLPDPFTDSGGPIYASRNDFIQACIMGRVRLGLLATAYALWLQLGLAALYLHLRPGDQVPAARILPRG